VSAIRRIDVCWAARVAGVASLVAHQAIPSSYGPPRLTLAYPAPGVSVPSERPTVVFHYESGEASDPLDLRSFMVWVGGADRTDHFRATADAAWGPIISGGGEGVRAHTVRARVCTVRGVCAEISTVVTVVALAATKNDHVNKERRGKIIDVVLEVARKLLKS
jgi:hypothetical protein